MLRLKHWLFRYSFCFLICAAILFIFISFCWEVPIPLLSTVLVFFYFLQKQSLDETRLMKEMITEFNRRYDTLNGRLAKIAETTLTPLSTCQKEAVIDYFNLCAEEYLFYTLGYVQPRVWEAWRAGMKVYRQDDRIKALWKEEKNKDSYYGFDFLK